MTTPRPQTLEQIKILIRRDFKLGDVDVPDDMPFFGGDVDLDSLDILLLMTSIEKHFKVKVPSEAVGKQAFVNVATLAAYVDQQIGGGKRSGAGRGGAGRRRLVAAVAAPGSFSVRVAHCVDSGRAAGAGRMGRVGHGGVFCGTFSGAADCAGGFDRRGAAQLSGLVGPDNGSRGGKLARRC